MGSDAPVLAVAATGGHLAELHHLVGRMPLARGGVVWATYDDPHSRSLLADEPVHHVRYTGPRDGVSVLLNVRHAVALLHRRPFRAVVSTGAGVALSVLPVARALGIPAHYIEPVTRVTGPSVTGRVLMSVPGVRTYTQQPGWAGEAWLYRGCVFDGVDVVSARGARDLRRLVVVLGQSPYGFRRLLQRLLEILPPSVDALWQTGATDVTGLRIPARPTVPAHELDAAIRAADAVVAHAGTGAALAALRGGKVPVLVPREPERQEQVDAHQVEFARAVAGRGLAVTAAADALTADLIALASSLRAVRRPPPPFHLA